MLSITNDRMLPRFTFFIIPSMFPHFPHQRPHEEPLEDGLHVIVEAHEAAAEQQTHVSAHVCDEAVGVIDDVLLPLLV